MWVKANLFYVATFSRALVAIVTGDAMVGATSCMAQQSSGLTNHLSTVSLEGMHMTR